MRGGIRAEGDTERIFGFSFAQAGYGRDNWQQLEADLRNQTLPLDAIASNEPNSFGDVYEIRGVLTGVNEVRLAVVTIWMVEYETQQEKFIALYPDKEVG